MNKVYLSGTIAEAPFQVGIQENPAHAVFRLNVSHKNSKGEWRRELYSINSWNAAAQWVLANLKQGQRVALVGYLTQRVVRSGDSTSVVVEVTSQEYMPLAFVARENAAAAGDAQAAQPDVPFSCDPIAEEDLLHDDFPDDLAAV